MRRKCHLDYSSRRESINLIRSSGNLKLNTSGFSSNFNIVKLIVND
jgi:hypothetical protein